MKRSHIPWLILLAAPVILCLCMFFGTSPFGLPESEGAFRLRLSRVAAGFVVGAALSCAGVVLQALLRNPLAEPYVLGVSGGAALGAAIAIMTGLSLYSIAAVPLTAFIFAVAALAMVYFLASRQGQPSVTRLILSGVIISAMTSSVLMFLISTASTHRLHSITWWMLGDLQVLYADQLRLCAIVIAAGLVVSWLLSSELNAFSLGREVAHYVGIRTDIGILAGLAVATLLAATAVSLAGLIGFVGLIVPHAARSLVGAEHRRLIPCAAIGGGLFLALCDAVARSILPNQELPVGVITALLGGPFFLAIMSKRAGRGWIE